MARTPKSAPPVEPKKPAARARPAPGPAAEKPRASQAAPAKAAPAKAAPARTGAKAATAKPSPARTGAKPSPTQAAPARASAKPVATRARIALGAGNIQAKPRATPRRPVTPADILAAEAQAAQAEAMAAAGPKRPRARKRAAPLSPDRLESLVAAARKSLEDDKAEDIRVLDVTGRASFTDRIIIATGLADRQIQAMATHLEEALAKEGMKLKRNAIEASPDWVLIDCGDMVIHLFKPEARETFRLEKMWGEDSPKADTGSGYEPT